MEPKKKSDSIYRFVQYHTMLITVYLTVGPFIFVSHSMLCSIRRLSLSTLGPFGFISIHILSHLAFPSVLSSLFPIRRFLLSDFFSVDLLSYLTFYPSTLFSMGVLYFNVLSVTHVHSNIWIRIWIWSQIRIRIWSRIWIWIWDGIEI
jgi:hypothetical protein